MQMHHSLFLLKKSILIFSVLWYIEITTSSINRLYSDLAWLSGRPFVFVLILSSLSLNRDKV